MSLSTSNPRLRQLIACELADFRLKLEHENGAPLTQDQDVAMLLDNLCDFLGLTTGERAFVLGPDLLVYLARLDGPVNVLGHTSPAIIAAYLDRAAQLDHVNVVDVVVI